MAINFDAKTFPNVVTGENKFTLREIFFKYVSHLPLFLLSMAICLGAANLYLRYVIPIYRAQANMLIKTADDNNTGTSTNPDLITNTIFGGKRINIDNEVERLRSNAFLSRVVAKVKYNIVYYDEGNVKHSNIYKACPIQFIPIKIDDSSSTHQLYFKSLSNSGGTVYLKKNENSINEVKFRWNDTLHFAGILFTLHKSATAVELSANKIYNIIWKPIAASAGSLRGSLSISPINTKATIIQISVRNENPEQAKDLLNTLIAEYSLMNIEDKNRVAQNTIRFVDEKLNAVTDELKSITKEIQDFKEQNQILDIQKQYQFYLDNSFANITDVNRIERENNISSWVKEYILKTTNKDSLVPSTLTINDPTLATLISQYNQIQLKKNAELKYNLLPQNPIALNYENQLRDLRRTIVEALDNVKTNNNNQVSTLKNRNAANKTVLSKIPKIDAALAELNRQQNIKQQLQLFLLQKREETEIGSSSTVSDYSQLEYADASGTPIEPNTNNIRNFSFLLGLILPIAIIYLLDTLNDKLITRDEITRKTNIPIAGEISHVDKVISNIVVAQSRNVIAEQFRILRSNLQFLLQDNSKGKVLLITSSISGEGKSFISANLAAVISLSGKKVALVEFDLRKLRSIVYTGEKQNSKGITNYLIGQTDNLEEIVTSVDNFPQLDIYRSGPLPPNPSELIMSDKVALFIQKLKLVYDYIIIDSAPVGLVSDSFSLLKYTDAVLYVVRQRYTYKKQLEFVNDLIAQGKLSKVSLVVNDVHLGGKYGYYGYGYGFGYGYVYRYGMGYAYKYGNYGGGYFSKRKDGYFDPPSKRR
jgi:capsular exopolysaccharide synthesis family protein